MNRRLAVAACACCFMGCSPATDAPRTIAATPATRASAPSALPPAMPQRRPRAEPPKVGDVLPDVVVYDADGKQHQLRALAKGQYTVLVLGCLT